MLSSGSLSCPFYWLHGILANVCLHSGDWFASVDDLKAAWCELGWASSLIHLLLRPWSVSCSLLTWKGESVCCQISLCQPLSQPTCAGLACRVLSLRVFAGLWKRGICFALFLCTSFTTYERTFCLHIFWGCWNLDGQFQCLVFLIYFPQSHEHTAFEESGSSAWLS